MQPPTAPKPQADENADELYRRHRHDLEHAVASAVRAPSELIEDACQNTWMIMLRAQPHCHCAFAWLRAVAIHEAYRLMAIERHQTTLASVAERMDDLRHVAAQESPEDSVEALEALQHLASLPERQRNDLALKIAGYSYKEIQGRTPGRTMTNVNKSLAKARARIRRWGPE
jgi:DNA-directed RNA polymerase specialized sigma24 family protein